MATPTQYEITHKELVEMLLEKAGITEGYWAPLVRFNIAALTAGPRPEEMFPSAVASVAGIGIQKVERDAQGVIVDASTLPHAQTAKVPNAKMPKKTVKKD